MAMITCRECKARISKRAAVCPHCGRPVKSGDLQKILNGCANASGCLGCLLILIGGAIGAVLLAALGTAG